MLFALETCLNGSQLTIVPYPFFFEPSDNLIIGLLYGLGLIVLDHNLIQPILKQPYSLHHRILLNIPQLVILNLLQFILQSEQYILPNLGLMFLLIQHDPQIILIHIGDVILCG